MINLTNNDLSSLHCKELVILSISRSHHIGMILWLGVEFPLSVKIYDPIRRMI